MIPKEWAIFSKFGLNPDSGYALRQMSSGPMGALSGLISHAMEPTKNGMAFLTEEGEAIPNRPTTLRPRKSRAILACSQISCSDFWNASAALRNVQSQARHASNRRKRGTNRMSALAELERRLQNTGALIVKYEHALSDPDNSSSTTSLAIGITSLRTLHTRLEAEFLELAAIEIAGNRTPGFLKG